MSEPFVNLTIDGVEVTVPKGTLIVDAAKEVGIEIPVFCYHPKLEPAGMCRMCLVEIGRPKVDRETRQVVLDDSGQPVIAYGRNLETACNTPVGEGWVVLVNSEKAIAGRREVVEFLLTSHPLDCPVCDKGGECPLQNLTMEHGPGKSRFLFDDKMHLDKHVPLGELIFLDRERCIQCSRCVRFQEEIAGDPVIAFSERGRRLEIVTYSEPGFDSYFSGNTTDICPVGALTTADFRFGARPWELEATGSVCTHCPVGCNTVLNIRREARSGGREVVKRVMPRQNEAVNEIWICDKGRFAHHYAGSDERLKRPMVRVNGELKETSWEEALGRIADGLKSAGSDVLGVAGGRASNEDFFNLRRLAEGLGGRAILHSRMAGGDLVQQVGVGKGTNLGDLGRGDAILVVASDLHEEAPIWWLRVKQAAARGAALVVANARPTRLDKYASIKLRFPYGQAVHSVLGMLRVITKDKALAKYGGEAELEKAGRKLSEAGNLVVFYGAEGLDYAGSEALARACASLLVASGHIGKPNNGLIAVWDRGNGQGAWDMGVLPEPEGVGFALRGMKAAYIVAADPLGDDEDLAADLEQLDFMVVQELFLTETARRADVVLPAQSHIEREGTYTNGERRLQRYFYAIQPLGECKADWEILAMVGRLLGLEMEAGSAGAVLTEISETVDDYSGLSYQALGEYVIQWPHVGGESLYFGGTAYPNFQGLGVQLGPEDGDAESMAISWSAPDAPTESGNYQLVPVVKLYDRGITVLPSEVLKPRLASPSLSVNPADAERMGLVDGGQAEVRWSGRSKKIRVQVDEGVPEGAALVPRSMGISLSSPAAADVRPAEE